MTLTNEQKEELRHVVLQSLALRAPAALTPRQLCRAMKKELPFLFEEPDAIAACELLRGMNPPLAETTVDEFGTTSYWRATSAGILKSERSE